jgi:hypothetical protein
MSSFAILFRFLIREYLIVVRVEQPADGGDEKGEQSQ